MGTALLFPQDCLQPRSRHKHQTRGMIYLSECAPRSKRNSPAPAHRHEAGLLPLPAHNRHSLPMSIPRCGSDTNQVKCRKGPEQRDIDHPSRLISDVPVYKILQRPKEGNAAVNLLAQFVMLDEVKAQSVMVVAKPASANRPQNDGAEKCIDFVKAEFGTLEVGGDGFKHKSWSSDTKPVKVCNEGGSWCPTNDMPKFLNVVHTSSVEGYKLSSTKAGASKSKNAMSQSGLDGSARRPPSKVVPKPFVTKAGGKVHNTSCNAMIVQRSEEPDSKLPHLQRTSTEPQISAHFLGQCKSKVMHMSFDNSKSESHVHGHGYSDSTLTLSCQERWAGPAYTSSPSPSSLPLPKLCLPQTRFSSLRIPPLVKQYSTSVYMQPFLGSSAPSESGGARDVAFATKSLRKMLNLDPC